MFVVVMLRRDSHGLAEPKRLAVAARQGWNN
jgi:hypothetical protein